MTHVSLYLDSSTWVHRLDGRTKVLSLLGFFTIALIFSDPWYLFPVMVVLAVLFLTAHSLVNIRKVWILLVLLFAYSGFLWPFFIDGNTPFFQIGPLIVTEEALAYAIGMGLRLTLTVSSGILLLSTTTVEDFAGALQQMGLPSPVGFAFSLAFRWVPTLLGAGGTIVQAQRSRGLDLTTGSLFAKIRRYPPLVVPLIGHTLRQTNLLAMALESKGFNPDRKQPSLPPLSMNWNDYLVLAVMLIVVGLSGWLRLQGLGTIDVRF